MNGDAITPDAARPDGVSPGAVDHPTAARPSARRPGASYMSRQHVFELVTDRLVEILAVDRERVTSSASLAGDLHADSLDLVEAVEAIEEALRQRGHHLHLPESALASWNKVDDVVTGIMAALEKGSA